MRFSLTAGNLGNLVCSVLSHCVYIGLVRAYDVTWSAWLSRLVLVLVLLVAVCPSLSRLHQPNPSKMATMRAAGMAMTMSMASAATATVPASRRCCTSLIAAVGADSSSRHRRAARRPQPSSSSSSSSSGGHAQCSSVHHPFGSRSLFGFGNAGKKKADTAASTPPQPSRPVLQQDDLFHSVRCSRTGVRKNGHRALITAIFHPLLLCTPCSSRSRPFPRCERRRNA